MIVEILSPVTSLDTESLPDNLFTAMYIYLSTLVLDRDSSRKAAWFGSNPPSTIPTNTPSPLYACDKPVPLCTFSMFTPRRAWSLCNLNLRDTETFFTEAMLSILRSWSLVSEATTYFPATTVENSIPASESSSVVYPSLSLIITDCLSPVFTDFNFECESDSPLRNV